MRRLSKCYWSGCTRKVEGVYTLDDPRWRVYTCRRHSPHGALITRQERARRRGEEIPTT